MLDMKDCRKCEFCRCCINGLYCMKLKKYVEYIKVPLCEE